MIYRQRETILDDLLLRIVYPWFTALHATHLLRLAHFWIVPVTRLEATPERDLATQPSELGVELASETAHPEPMGRVTS